MSRLKRDQEDLAYRIYVTDALRGLTHNTLIDTEHMQYAMEKRWISFIAPEPEETRDPEEIIQNIVRKLGE
jgi:hypothetical protein